MTVAPSPTELFRTHAAFVWRALRYLGVREADLPDQCQEVFIVVHRKFGEFEGRSAIGTWLYGIALRVAADYRKRAHVRREEVGVEQVDDGVAPPQERFVARQALLRALDTLDEHKRAAFVLHAVEGLTLREVAELMGCPLQTAYARFSAARDSLARVLSADEQAGAASWRTALTG